jgi:hypothetical protein
MGTDVNEGPADRWTDHVDSRGAAHVPAVILVFLGWLKEAEARTMRWPGVLFPSS